MAKNTKLQNNTEEFIESVVEKILQKQAAQGQTSNYVQVLDKNGNPPQIPVGVLTTTGNYNHAVYEPIKTDTSYWNDESNISAKKASPVDEVLMNLEENILVTYKLIRELVKKLEPITFVVPTECQTQEINPQNSIPLCATIERNTNVVVNIKKEIEYLLQYVGI